MKVLFVARAKPHVLEGVGRFVSDQRMALQKEGLDVDLLPIPGKGILDYIRFIKKLNQYLKNNPDIDLVHAHNGLTGFFTNLQRKKPTIVTYHGTDINNKITRFFSIISTKLATWNIFISDNLRKKTNTNSAYSIIPCGVDTALFKPIDKQEARRYFGFSEDEKLILFAGNFRNTVKNYPLAKHVVDQIGSSVRLIELKGLLRNEVSIMMNAVDMVLLTSFSEGSPQFIKEAMACNCPIVATNVGDIALRIDNVSNCYVTSFDETEIKNQVLKVLSTVENRTNGRETIISQGLDNKEIAQKLIQIYHLIHGSK